MIQIFFYVTILNSSIQLIFDYIILYDYNGHNIYIKAVMIK